MLKRLTTLMVAGVVAAALGCAAADQPIAIGLVGPFSEPRGASMRMAAELAIGAINQAGGVRGRALRLVVQDDSARPEVAVAAARRFYGDAGVVAVIGHLTSAATLAAAPIYGGGRNPLPVISPSASAPGVSQAGPYVFRVCPDDIVHGTRLAGFAVQRLGARNAEILYQTDEYGRGIRETFSAEFRRLGGRIIGDDPFVPEIPSFEPYLRRLRQRGGADVLLIASTAAIARRILPTLDTVGLKPRIMGGDALAGLETIPEADGVYMSAAYLPDATGERNAAFVAAYRAAYGDRLPDHRGAAAYDIVHLLAHAIDLAGADRRRIHDFLAGIGTESPPFEGVTGRIVFDEQGDVPGKTVVIGVARSGRLVTAGGR